MANNSIWNETKVRWFDTNRLRILHGRTVQYGKVVAQSRVSDEHVIVEWDVDGFPTSTEHVDDLIEV